MIKGCQENRLKEDFSLTMSSPENFFFPERCNLAKRFGDLLMLKLFLTLQPRDSILNIELPNISTLINDKPHRIEFINCL